MCELLKTRRSVRKYRPEQVPDELLDAVLAVSYTHLTLPTT